MRRHDFKRRVTLRRRIIVARGQRIAVTVWAFVQRRREVELRRQRDVKLRRLLLHRRRCRRPRKTFVTRTPAMGPTP